MTPQVLYKFPEMAGESFMPSNGTEGMIFNEAFCENCIHEKFIHTQKYGDKQCGVLDRVFLNAPDPQPEWVFNEEGWPICKDWIKWDWERDDDDNWSDPVLPDPIDPSQLSLFPLYPSEVHFEENKQLLEEVKK